jgi:hypothetical protein
MTRGAEHRDFELRPGAQESANGGAFDVEIVDYHR